MATHEEIVFCHERGHAAILTHLGIPNRIEDALCHHKAKTMPLLDYVTMLVAGVTNEYLHGVEPLTNGIGGDTQLILAALGEPPERELNYSCAILAIIEGRKVHPAHNIPPEHIELLAAAIGQAKKILGDHNV